MKINKEENTLTVLYDGKEEEVQLDQFVNEWEFFDGFEEVKGTYENTDTEDHSLSYEMVIKHVPSGTFYKLTWDEPRWEDSISPDDLYYSIEEVFPKEVTTTVYE